MLLDGLVERGLAQQQEAEANPHGQQPGHGMAESAGRHTYTHERHTPRFIRPSKEPHSSPNSLFGGFVSDSPTASEGQLMDMHLICEPSGDSPSFQVISELVFNLRPHSGTEASASNV